MKIEQHADAHGMHFIVTGSLTGTEHSTIHLFEAISIAMDKKPGEITVDLARTSYIDSLSIGLLVGIILKCREKEVGMRLVNMPDHIREVLDMVKLKAIFPELY